MWIDAFIGNISEIRLDSNSDGACKGHAYTNMDGPAPGYAFLSAKIVSSPPASAHAGNYRLYHQSEVQIEKSFADRIHLPIRV